MKIVVAVRCYNEEKNIERFLRGYSFADQIVISDGGSTDGSVSLIESRKKYDRKLPPIELLHFTQRETVGGYTWNPDAPHMNFVLDAAKALKPDWLIFDDMDDIPNRLLRKNARDILEACDKPQVNAFRLYMWGDDQFFPQMNLNFHPDYRSLWAWKPKEINISADMGQKHGTIIGTTANNYAIELPMCLLHKSWHPATIDQKINRYNTLGLPMTHPLQFAGKPEPLPDFAREQ